MKLRIRLFAGLSERIGAGEAWLEVHQDGMSAGQMKQLLMNAYPDAAEQIAVSFVAKNQAYANDETIIGEKDEIALIPPVSGGGGTSNMSGAATAVSDYYTITREPLNIEETARKAAHPNHGASLVFIGTTREYTAGQRTMLLEYEAYEPMALRTMKQIGSEIAEKWPGCLTAITHRLGKVDIGDASVVIAVSSPHRAACYEASRYAIERLKQIVPIWKKEIWEDGSEWKGHQQGPWNPLAGARDTEHGGADGP